MSHTVTAKVKLANPGDNKGAPLCKAIVKMGGKVIGKGKHKLYSGTEEGFAFSLPEWRFPLVLKDDGTLKFDDYNGSWGKRSDVEKLTGLTGIELARAEAEKLGWLVQDQSNGSIQVFHPSGGHVTIGEGGQVDATGFVGVSCDSATSPLVTAMGGALVDQKKPEYWVEQASVQQQSE